MKQFFLKIIYKVLAYKAHKIIKCFDPFVIAVTGSVGKTSTKEAIYTVLKQFYGKDAQESEGSLNAEIGLPLSILGYKKLPNKFFWPFFLFLVMIRPLPKNYPKYLILEMGIEHKGDIKYFCGIARPDLAIITSLAGAHLANFLDEEEYQQEKLEIISQLKSDGKAIVNYDDPILRKLREDNIISVGIENSDAFYQIKDIKLSLQGTEFRFTCPGYKVMTKSRLIGKQMIYPLLFAFAVADTLKLSLIASSKALLKMEPMPGRMQPVEGIKDSIIIDDTYNANPSSMMGALEFLGPLSYPGKKVAILGNMNELGKDEVLKHQIIGQFASKKCDLAIFVGKNGEEMFKAFGNPKKSLYFKNRAKLLAKINSIINGGELVLIKASQNDNYFEEVVKKLMKNPEKAKNLLVRQSGAWLKKKRAG